MGGWELKSVAYTDLSDVVEIPVRHGLLTRQFSELVQQHVQLILGGEITQSSITEGFQGSVSDHGAQEVHVSDEGRQVWIRIRERLAISQVLVIGEQIEHAIDRRDLVILRRWKFAFPRIAPRGRRVYRVIC